MHDFARPLRRENFQIAVVCALPLEYDATTLAFDELWDEDGDKFGRAQNGPNHYTTGRIGRHNVVLALLPNMGKASSSGMNFPPTYHPTGTHC
ncbi:phosphorylase superfamily protein [Colletotrichum kahawae]|uniref:Phosphorylase superfamily protein n=1 Tax=Colletotrichum kahawae TaxID=34407 RepID=A0AAE0D2Z5_COLKA|nr:phosphorylase superfamily protein [Colletotrichum kahawae]